MAYDADWLMELFEPVGPVRLKRMFSGHGVYAGDFCIALAINPGLCLRVDEETRGVFEALGAAPFTYDKKDKKVTVQAWWRLPDEIVDDPDELARLARLSLDAARRRPPKKPRKPKLRKPEASKASGLAPRPAKKLGA
jgi:DNA transformation protein